MNNKNTAPALPPFWYTLHRLTAVRRWLLHTAWTQSENGRFLKVVPVEDALYCPRVQMLEGHVGLQRANGREVTLTAAISYAAQTPCDCHGDVTSRKLYEVAESAGRLTTMDEKARARMRWW